MTPIPGNSQNGIKKQIIKNSRKKKIVGIFESNNKT
jgi:hypothetical protein